MVEKRLFLSINSTISIVGNYTWWAVRITYTEKEGDETKKGEL